MAATLGNVERFDRALEERASSLYRVCHELGVGLFTLDWEHLPSNERAKWREVILRFGLAPEVR